MKTLLTAILLVSALLTGCGDGFPGQEMSLGTEDKTRPYAVTVEPPEVAPGDTVTVRLRYQAARPSDVVSTWRVALDYATGPYEADEIERRLVPLPDVAPPVVDQFGFMTQVFQYAVPDSVPLWSTAIADVITDPSMLYILDLLEPDGVGEPPHKTEVDAWLRGLTPDDLAAMNPLERTATQRLADLFSCSIRFRVTLDANTSVDVTRNLTVRYSSRLGSDNVNVNAEITRFEIGVIPAPDVDISDLEEWEDRIVWYAFDGTSENGLPEARVPNEPGNTYLVSVRQDPQLYTSPFELDQTLEEQGDYRWYFLRLDAPESGHDLYVDEEGEPTEMFMLDEDVRMLLPGGDSNFRLLSVVYDKRPEWIQYAAVPGATVTVGEVVFEAP